MKRFKKGFTLAEVLITLAIIGVVAAIAIPSVISNSQQQEFKTGLRKAVSVLNSAITMNMAIDGETPYDNKDLFGYLTRHMSTLKAPAAIDFAYYYKSHDGSVTVGGHNYGFYTTDGIRFEYYSSAESTSFPGPKLHESGVRSCVNNADGFCGGCGSYGLNHNPNGTTKPPCAILVDVNGDKKPYPGNVNCKWADGVECFGKYNVLKGPLPGEKKIKDIFTILITDEKAIPYGVTAQKAMYQAQK